jgi:DNA mismatch repair protein MutS
MPDKQTPLMRQYQQIKKKYPDTVLLFRLGDFFETFEDDALIASRVCGLTLTKRNNGGAEETPLAGFPHHQLDNYLPKLVRAGYRVAVCEQLEDPKHARGIVRRDVVEVVTPGVAFNDKLLDTKRNNYLAAIAYEHRKTLLVAGVACVDISTGEFFTTEIPATELAATLEAVQPAEILVAKKQLELLPAALRPLPHLAATSASSPAPSPITPTALATPITRLEDWIFEERFGRELLLKHFKTQNLKGFGIEEFHAGVMAAGAALHYLSESQRGHVPHIRRISAYNPSEYMALDFATKRNLEITFSMQDASKQGTLLGILDKTQTAMGGRLFAKWMTRPLRRLQPIVERQSAIAALVDDDGLRAALRHELAEVGDIERLMSKISTGRATPRDVASLKSTLARLPRIRSLVAEAAQAASCAALTQVVEQMLSVDDVVKLIATALSDEPPAQVGGGGVFREGFSAALDEIRNTMYSGKNWIAEFQERERVASGIASLKVGFNNVFGYYIEITNAHKARIPAHYDRKQTLTNAERYTTPELKEMEQKILSAEERLGEVERELFNELRTAITEAAERAQTNAAMVAMLDCFASFAQAAREYDYCRPTLDESERVDITNGRHPVVERLLPVGERYVPNSTHLSTDDEQLHIITGPNMSGKSSYLRQVGLIVLLAHIGGYVPAKDARIGLADRIFTRVGAQDNITAGESTFLVEMQEAANILNNATRKSLILLDEVGRGTATFDGISIAWSLAEYLHERVGAKTLFATHYHELTDIASRLARARTYKADVQEVGATIVFTRRIIAGTADHSFGIHVAEMAGLPKEVTERAKVIMHTLEKRDESGGMMDRGREAMKPDMERVAARQGTSEQGTNDQEPNDSNDSMTPKQMAPKHADVQEPQISLFEIRDDRIRERLQAMDVNAMTPLQALQALSDLKEMLR